MADEKDPERTTVADCRQAIRLHEWELRRLVEDLAGRSRKKAGHRRAYLRDRKACARLWRKCLDRVERIELMRDVIRSSPDGVTVDAGEPVEPAPAGLALLQRIDRMLEEADAQTETGLRAFFRDLAELQDFAKDFFDYAGVKLVYELGELLADAQRADAEKLGEMFGRVAELRRDAGEWFE